MESWITFVLAAQFIWAVCSLIDKVVISKGHIKNPLVYIVLNGLMNIFLIFLLPFFSLEPLKFADFMIVLASSTSASIGIILYYKAVQYDEISRINILLQFIPIFVLALSFLLLNESPTMYHLAGFLFLFCAGIISSYKKAEKFLSLNNAVYYMLLSGLFIAVAYVAAKHVFNVTSFWSGILWLRLTSFVPLVLLLIPSIRNEFIKTFMNMRAKMKSLLSFKMAIDFSAFILADYALLIGPVSLVSALSSSSAPLFVFALALLASIYLPKIIKEDISKTAIITKGIAIAFVIAGIAIINLV